MITFELAYRFLKQNLQRPHILLGFQYQMTINIFLLMVQRRPERSIDITYLRHPFRNAKPGRATHMVRTCVIEEWR